MKIFYSITVLVFLLMAMLLFELNQEQENIVTFNELMEELALANRDVLTMKAKNSFLEKKYCFEGKETSLQVSKVQSLSYFDMFFNLTRNCKKLQYVNSYSLDDSIFISFQFQIDGIMDVMEIKLIRTEAGIKIDEINQVCELLDNCSNFTHYLNSFECKESLLE